MSQLSPLIQRLWGFFLQHLLSLWTIIKPYLPPPRPHPCPPTHTYMPDLFCQKDETEKHPVSPEKLTPSWNQGTLKGQFRVLLKCTCTLFWHKVSSMNTADWAQCSHLVWDKTEKKTWLPGGRQNEIIPQWFWSRFSSGLNLNPLPFSIKVHRDNQFFF